MSRIPLSEQLTAMAFVDELRHEQKQVQEHLDLPRRRAEIAERIRAYYVSNDIAFDDDLIEQGVRQFFAHRLMFEAPQIKWFDAWLVEILGNRDVASGDTKSLHPWRWLLIVVLMLGAILIIPRCSTAIVSDVKVPEIKREADRLGHHNFDLNMELEKQRNKLTALLRGNAEQSDANASRLLTRVQKVLPVGNMRDVAEPIRPDNVNAIERQVIALGQAQEAFWRALPQIEADMKYAGGIIWMRQGIKEMQQDPKRAAAIAQSSDLYQRLALLEQQLSLMDNDIGYQDALFAYRDLYRDLIDTSMLTLLARRHNELKSRLGSQAISSEQRIELEGISHEIDADLEKGDSDAAETKINQLTQKMKAAGYMIWIGRIDSDTNQRVASNLDMMLNG
ncbi:DUF6384 family protein [Pseudomonas brassicacearum]|uniref:Uncharacterized protein n=1 Tax=Pseudomonas brassicacearum TaxID=930166 RepID=A0A423GU04_9PSED|nr:DUF6384 family protein [Pseudomonas brassicacearum]RON00702.1 hypothetical protein BK658_09255 [Pseudomonas brassicacearum]